MSTWKKLAALLAAGALGLALTGTALAAPASDQGVTPTEHEGNITADGEGNSDAAECDTDDAIETGDSSGEGDSVNGVHVVWTYDGATKAVSFVATGGLVTIAYIKGGDGYNEYNYNDALGHGVASDGNLFAPDNGSDGPAGLSHAVFCTGPGEEETTPPSFEASEEAETDAPSDTPSFQASEAANTDAPTQCPCDTIVGTGGTSGPADGAWLLVVALGVLLASVVVLTPARASRRR